MNEWVPRWRTNGWKTSAGSEVKNKEMLMMLDHLIKSMDSVSWVQ
jgi:ribonuclease HI